MRPHEREPVLAAVRVTDIRRAPAILVGSIARIATLVCESSRDENSFETDTGLLDASLLDTIERLQAHGFTVVALPNDIRYEYDTTKMMNLVLSAALQKAKTLIDLRGEPDMERGYDKALAKAVLEVLDPAYPSGHTNMEIKHALPEEPSDRALLNVLDALEGEGFISGKGLRSSTSGRRELIIMANVKITGEGRKHLAGTASQPNTVVHGDQNINYGTAGAIGTRSTGTVNFQQQWSTLQNQVDLKLLATQLDYLRTAYTPEPSSQRSHARTAGFLAEAEEYAEQGDGSKTMEALSKVGSYMLDFAKEVGTDLATRVIAKATGLDS